MWTSALPEQDLRLVSHEPNPQVLPVVQFLHFQHSNLWPHAFPSNSMAWDKDLLVKQGYFVPLNSQRAIISLEIHVIWVGVL